METGQDIKPASEDLMPQEQVNLAPAEEETEKWKVPVYHFEDVTLGEIISGSRVCYEATLKGHEGKVFAKLYPTRGLANTQGMEEIRLALSLPDAHYLPRCVGFTGGYDNKERQFVNMVMYEYYTDAVPLAREGSAVHTLPFMARLRVLLHALQGPCDLNSIGYCHGDFTPYNILAVKKDEVSYQGMLVNLTHLYNQADSCADDHTPHVCYTAPEVTGYERFFGLSASELDNLHPGLSSLCGPVCVDCVCPVFAAGMSLAVVCTYPGIEQELMDTMRQAGDCQKLIFTNLAFDFPTKGLPYMFAQELTKCILRATHVDVRCRTPDLPILIESLTKLITTAKRLADAQYPHTLSHIYPSRKKNELTTEQDARRMIARALEEGRTPSALLLEVLANAESDSTRSTGAEPSTHSTLEERVAARVELRYAAMEAAAVKAHEEAKAEEAAMAKAAAEKWAARQAAAAAAAAAAEAAAQAQAAAAAEAEQEAKASAAAEAQPAAPQGQEDAAVAGTDAAADEHPAAAVAELPAVAEPAAAAELAAAAEQPAVADAASVPVAAAEQPAAADVPAAAAEQAQAGLPVTDASIPTHPLVKALHHLCHTLSTLCGADEQCVISALQTSHIVTLIHGAYAGYEGVPLFRVGMAVMVVCTVPGTEEAVLAALKTKTKDAVRGVVIGKLCFSVTGESDMLMYRLMDALHVTVIQTDANKRESDMKRFYQRMKMVLKCARGAADAGQLTYTPVRLSEPTVLDAPDINGPETADTHMKNEVTAEKAPAQAEEAAAHAQAAAAAEAEKTTKAAAAAEAAIEQAAVNQQPAVADAPPVAAVAEVAVAAEQVEAAAAEQPAGAEMPVAAEQPAGEAAAVQAAVDLPTATADVPAADAAVAADSPAAVAEQPAGEPQAEPQAAPGIFVLPARLAVVCKSHIRHAPRSKRAKASVVATAAVPSVADTDTHTLRECRDVKRMRLDPPPGLPPAAEPLAAAASQPDSAPAVDPAPAPLKRAASAGGAAASDGASAALMRRAKSDAGAVRIPAKPHTDAPAKPHTKSAPAQSVSCAPMHGASASCVTDRSSFTETHDTPTQDTHGAKDGTHAGVDTGAHGAKDGSHGGTAGAEDGAHADTTQGSAGAKDGTDGAKDGSVPHSTGAQGDVDTGAHGAKDGARGDADIGTVGAKDGSAGAHSTGAHADADMGALKGMKSECAAGRTQRRCGSVDVMQKVTQNKVASPGSTCLAPEPTRPRALRTPVDTAQQAHIKALRASAQSFFGLYTHTTNKCDMGTKTCDMGAAPAQQAMSPGGTHTRTHEAQATHAKLMDAHSTGSVGSWRVGTQTESDGLQVPVTVPTCECVTRQERRGARKASVLMTSLPTPPAQAAPSVPSVHTHDVSAQQHNTHNTAHMVAVLVTKQESAPAAHTKASGLPKREGVPAQASVGLWGWLTSWAA